MSVRNSACLTLIKWLPLLMLVFGACSYAEVSRQAELDAKAKQLINEFAKSLKSELSGAIKQGGLENGVEVCSARAAEIASELSDDGWQVKRVSLKNRSPKNVPDSWEREVLLDFNARQKNGEDPKSMFVSQSLQSQTSEDRFRAMKAIPTQSICLACHGEQVSPAVYDVIQKHYPEDKATGYKLGEIRGAFSLLKTY